MNELQHLITETNDPDQVFELLDLLGQGAYGSVSKALHKQTGVLYAIKILPATSGVEITAIKKQIGVLKQCNDDHIVKYYGSYYKDNHLWIVMEYCIAGSITDIMQITKKKFNQNQIASILESVLKGLDYLHARKIIHRDVKAANVLIDQKGNAKLADFGVSAEGLHTHSRFKTHIGSPYWMSPEILNYNQYNSKTDIWSLGITAIEIAEGQVPNSHLKPFMAVFMLKSNPVQSLKNPSQHSPQFNHFISQCLQINPSNRPQAKALLQHNFIKKYSKGQRLLSQLVLNSIQQIQQFRMNQSRNSSFAQIIVNANADKQCEYAQEDTKTVVENGREGQCEDCDQGQFCEEEGEGDIGELGSSMIIVDQKQDKFMDNSFNAIDIDSSMIQHNQNQSQSQNSNPSPNSHSDPLSAYINQLKAKQNLQSKYLQMLINNLNKYDKEMRDRIEAIFIEGRDKARKEYSTMVEIWERGNQGDKGRINGYKCRLMGCQTVQQFLLMDDASQKQQSQKLLKLRQQIQTPYSKIGNKITESTSTKKQNQQQSRQKIKSFLLLNNETAQTQKNFKKCQVCSHNETHSQLKNRLISTQMQTQTLSQISGFKQLKCKQKERQRQKQRIPYNSSRIMIKRTDQRALVTESQVKQFTNDPQIIQYLLENNYLKSQSSIVQSRSYLLGSANNLDKDNDKERQKNKEKVKNKQHNFKKITKKVYTEYEKSLSKEKQKSQSRNKYKSRQKQKQIEKDKGIKFQKNVKNLKNKRKFNNWIQC